MMHDMTEQVVVRPLEDSMPLRWSLTKIFGVSLSRWTGPAVVLGLFAVSAGGCGGCDDTELVCDEAGRNCEICDGYGCHPADPNGNLGGNVSTGSKGNTGSGSVPACDASTSSTACPCDAVTPCSGGLSCVNGVCIPGCEFSYECGPGNVCINGGCAAGCDAITACATGYTCSKGACVPDPKNPECSESLPCTDGEICVGGFCTTGCAANADCAPGSICDGGTHACVPDQSPKPACSAAIPCTGVGQVCLQDGYCHYPCDTTDVCKKIDARFVACDQSICKTIEEVDPQCSLDKPCDSGKDCVSNLCL